MQRINDVTNTVQNMTTMALNTLSMYNNFIFPLRTVNITFVHQISKVKQVSITISMQLYVIEIDAMINVFKHCSQILGFYTAVIVQRNTNMIIVPRIPIIVIVDAEHRFLTAKCIDSLL